MFLQMKKTLGQLDKWMGAATANAKERGFDAKQFVEYRLSPDQFGFAAKDFEGAATRVITQPRWEGKVMTGADYFLEHAVPNFFFHATTAYAILRHGGVPIGKRDFLGTLTQRMP
jgi:hypothetical protein